MMPRSFPVILLLVIPSAIYLWHFSDIPQFGYFQDDGLFYVSAKSLADGGRYRIESLPGEPAQTKFPPLYPLLLSAAWRIDPQFSRNLHLAAWISWLALPAVLVLAVAYFPKLGVSGWRAWLLLCLMAVNPYVFFYSSQLMSELLFLALILAAMLLVERCVTDDSGIALTIAAGATAELAYLTRTAGIALLPAVVVYCGMRGKWRKGFWFAAAVAPFVAGWMLWLRLYQTHTADSTWIDYTDYLGDEIYTLMHVSLRVLLWKNVESLFWGLGSLFLPKVESSQVLKVLASAMGVAMISGVVRIVRRGHGALYALFAAGSVLILILLYSPPDERYVLPLFPLAAAGLLVEMEHLAGMVRVGLWHREVSQRIAASALAATATVILAGSVAIQIYVTSGLPDAARSWRQLRADRVAAYRWIAENVPADASLLTAGRDDPVLFLYSGRHAIHNLPPFAFSYQNEHSRLIDWIGNPVPFARANRLRYFEFSTADESRERLNHEDRTAAEHAIEENPNLRALCRNGPVTIYALPR
jgi:hypothetical protein